MQQPCSLCSIQDILIWVCSAQLHGTCLGFEALAIIVSGDTKILSKFDSYDNASPLILTEDGQSGSAFFSSMPRDLFQAVQEEPLAMENHGRGEHAAQCMMIPLSKLGPWPSSLCRLGNLRI